MFVLDTHDPQVTSADGLKIWAAQAGQPPTDAPTIVFIPGFASSSLLFDHQFRDEELLSKYSLVRSCFSILASLAPLFFPRSARFSSILHSISSLCSNITRLTC